MNNTPNMQTEPALTIGQVFANKTMIQPVIAAVIAVVATTFKITIDAGLADNITTVVIFAAVAWGALSAQLEQKKLALKQAAVTREAVYSPATTQALVSEAAKTGDATVAPPPAQ